MHNTAKMIFCLLCISHVLGHILFISKVMVLFSLFVIDLKKKISLTIYDFS